MSSQHKRPILAFVVLVVLAAALIGNGVRANAEHGRFIAAGVISASTPLIHGTVGAPTDTPDATAAGPSHHAVRSTGTVLPAAADLVAAATPARETESAPSTPAAQPPAHRPHSANPPRRHTPPHPLPDPVRVVVHAVRADHGHGHGHGRAHAPGQLAKVVGDLVASHGDHGEHGDHGKHRGHDKHPAKLVARLLGR